MIYFLQALSNLWKLPSHMQVLDLWIGKDTHLVSFQTFIRVLSIHKSVYKNNTYSFLDDFVLESFNILAYSLTSPFEWVENLDVIKYIG